MLDDLKVTCQDNNRQNGNQSNCLAILICKCGKTNDDHYFNAVHKNNGMTYGVRFKAMIAITKSTDMQTGGIMGTHQVK